MAGGVVYELNTWSAKRVIGDSSASAAAQALLQTGEDVATDIWILNRTNRASLYGIKYKYDNSTNGTKDKIELYGGYTANAPTAWIQLDTGDAYFLGCVGIGDEPDESYQLYVNGTTGLAGGHLYLTGAVSDSSTGNTTQIIFGTPASNHVAISSNTGTVIINPTSATTTGQIVLATDGDSAFTAGTLAINTTAQSSYTLYVNGTSYLNDNARINGYLYFETGKQLYMNYNSTDWCILRTFNNGNIGLQAAGSGLYIGYDNTLETHLHYSNGTTRTNYFTVNSDGAYAHTRFGVNGQNTSYTLYVNGTGYFTDNVTISHTASADMAHSSANPKITFSENGTQPVHLIYTDWDAYRAPAGLKVVGGADASPAWFEVEGSLYLGAPTATGTGIYWNPYVESTTDASDAGSIYQIKSGVAGGTELRISQQNDQTDAINICAPYYIYLNSKRAFTINDTWLRINENAGFSSGTYFGATTVRTDGTLQVGSGGANFYANSSGNGYFSGKLHIASTEDVGKDQNGALVIGTKTGENIGIDGNEIMARNNSAVSTLYINSEGGNVSIGSGGITSTGGISATAGSIWAGTNGNTAAERQVGVQSGAGQMYMYSVASTSGNRGIYVPAHGNGAAKSVFVVDTDNAVTFNGSLAGNATTATTATNSNYLISNTRMDYGWNGVNYFNLSAARSATVKNNQTPYASATWTHILRFNHANNAGYYTDLAIPFNGNSVWYRRIAGGTLQNAAYDSNTGWVELLDAINYTGYTVTKTGSGASGTWGINITGRAYSLKDRTNDNTTYLNYGAAGLAGSAISWMCCWNGYEVRAISKAETFNVVRDNGGDSRWINTAGDTMTGALHFANGTLNNVGDDCAMGDQNVAGAFCLKGLNGATNIRFIQYGGTAAGTISWDGTKFSMTGTVSTSISGNAGTASKFYVTGSSSTLYLVGVSGYSTENKTGYIYSPNYISGGNLYSTKVYNAVWNDYAECRQVETEEPGYCVTETETGTMIKTTKRLQAGCKITSDTFGTCMGETETAKTPIAVAGRVLVYPYRNRSEYKLGAAVCSAPNGMVDIMTRDEIMMYPECIVGTVSEIPNYEVWQSGNKEFPQPIDVNGRIWIYVR